MDNNMTDIFTLDKLKNGEKGMIFGVFDTCGIKERLADLGFTRGADIRALMCDGSRSLRAYEICGTVVAVRRADAQKVELDI